MRALRVLCVAVVSLSFFAATSGCGGGGGGGGGRSNLRVGVLHSLNSDDLDDTISKLEGFFDSVTAINAGDAVPTLGQVQAFDVVLVVGDVNFQDATDMGDVLADAVDSGVGVVLAVFTTAYPQSVAGRFAADEYFAILGPNNQADGDGPIGFDVLVPAHPLMTGVSTFGGGTDSYRPASGYVVVGGSTVVATWLDGGTPLIVERTLPNGELRVDLGFWPVTSDGDDGGVAADSDAMRIVANALKRVGGEL